MLTSLLNLISAIKPVSSTVTLSNAGVILSEKSRSSSYPLNAIPVCEVMSFSILI